MFIKLESGEGTSHVREIVRYTVRYDALSRGDDYIHITVWEDKVTTTGFVLFDRYAECVTSKEFADTGAQLATDLGFEDLASSVHGCWMRAYIMNSEGKTIDKYEADSRLRY